MREEIYQKRMYDSNWRNETGIQRYDFWSVGNNVEGADGQNILPFGTRESIIKEQDQETKEIMKAYGIEIWKDMCPPAKPSPWGFAWKLILPNNTEGAIAEEQVNNEIRRKALPRIVLAGTEEEFEVEWKMFQKQLEHSEIYKRENELAIALQKRMSLWD